MNAARCRLPLMLCLFLAVLTPVAPAVGQADETLTVATYNVENAFDVFDDPYTADEETGIKPRHELEAIARAIRTLDADVVGFAELENEHVLRAMVAEFLPDMGYTHIASQPTNSGRGINLGVISRAPILRLTSYRMQTFSLPGREEETWRFARDLMHVTVEAPGGRELHLFQVHFKSKASREGDPQSAAWRLAEATRARAIIDGLLRDQPRAWVAIMGDFNDLPDSPPLEALLQGGALVDAHADLPPAERITYLNEPYRSTIDYILVSRALGRRLVPGSARVLADAELLAGSDHAPLSVSFDLGQTPTAAPDEPAAEATAQP